MSRTSGNCECCGGRGRESEALAHLMSVNRISQQDAELLVEHAFDAWEIRSRQSWIQDLTWLRLRASDYGLTEADVARAEQLLGRASQISSSSSSNVPFPPV